MLVSAARLTSPPAPAVAPESMYASTRAAAVAVAEETPITTAPPADASEWASAVLPVSEPSAFRLCRARTVSAPPASTFAEPPMYADTVGSMSAETTDMPTATAPALTPSVSSSTLASETASTVTAPVVFTAAMSPIHAEIVGFTVPSASLTPTPTKPAEIATVLTSIWVSELAVTDRLPTTPTPLPI